jgi:hypothetical protein
MQSFGHIKSDFNLEGVMMAKIGIYSTVAMGAKQNVIFTFS